MDDKHHLNPKKLVQTAGLIDSATAAVEEDCCQFIKPLVAAYGVSFYTIHSILDKNLGPEEKSSRWVPKLLSSEQKEEGVRTCSSLITVSMASPWLCWRTL
jgi:hypothetical protein